MLQTRLLKIGHGFNVHRIAPTFDVSKPLKLGGVEFADRITLEAHSDGDMVLHAVCDALLGRNSSVASHLSSESRGGALSCLRYCVVVDVNSD